MRVCPNDLQDRGQDKNVLYVVYEMNHSGVNLTGFEVMDACRNPYGGVSS